MADIFDQLVAQQSAQPAAGGDVFDQLIRQQTSSFTPTAEAPMVSGESNFLKFLDLINTPQQMLFGALTAGENESVTAAAKRGAQQNLGGFDVVGQQFFSDDREAGFFTVAGATVASTLADIVIDPLNLIPFGKLAGAAKSAFSPIAKAGSKVIGKSELAVKGIQLFSKTAFRTDAEKTLFDIIDLNRSKLNIQQGQILSDAVAREKLITSVAKQTGRSVDDVRRNVLLLEETPLPEAQLPLFPALEAAEEAKRLAKVVSRGGGKFKGVDDPGALSRAFTGGDPLPHPGEQLALFDPKKGKGPKTTVAAPIESGAMTSKDVKARLIARGLASNPVVRTEGKQYLLFPFEKQISDSANQVREAMLQARIMADDPTRKLALSFKETAEDLLLAEQKAGLPISELADSNLDYALHLLTPEARKAIMELPQFKGMARRFSPAHASEFSRLIRGKSVTEINELARRGELPGFEGQKFAKFMVDDPVALEAVRKMRSAKAMADYQLLQESAVRLGLPKATAPAHWVELGIANSSDPRLAAIGERFKGVVFDPDVAKHLNTALGTTALPEGLNLFLNLFDSVQGVWKGITLAIFPAYHFRNIVGNVWNNALAGMVDPEWYRRAARIQEGRVPSMQLPSGKVVDTGIIKTLLDDLGVVGRGQTVGEVPRMTKTVTKEATKIGRLQTSFGTADIPGIGKGVEVGFKVGGQLEDNARIAHFLYRLDKGDTPLQAAMSVKKYLFDYQEGLTSFEKAVMRRIFPFYAWTRFNVPLQAAALVENPRPFVHLAQVVRSARGDEPGLAPDEFHTKILPDFIKENSGIAVRRGPDGNPEYFLLGGWIPAADLEVLARPNGVLSKALGLLSPLIKIPTEQAFNIDLFLRRKIEEFPGEKQVFMGVPVRRRLVHFVRFFRLASELDRLTRGALDKELTVQEQTAVGRVLRSLFGLKTSRVNLSRQLRRRQAQQKELLRKARGIAKRGDEADNLDVLRPLLINPEESE
jgi:hypothetical protein